MKTDIDMKRILFIAMAATAMLTACSQKAQSPFERKVNFYANVTVEAPDLSGISDNGKEVLNLYRFAADEADSIYWEQYSGDRTTLLNSISDADQREYAAINYGPWDRFTGKSFVTGYADRLPGVNFYPADLTADEFANYSNPDKTSPYTLIRRGADGQLQTVWYHDAYKSHIDKIVNYLTAAADITIKPSVKRYLLAKAEALRTDNYYESGLAWLDMTDSKMDIVIGPDESADDQLFGLKRSYEAFVLLKNEARTNELTQFASQLDEFQAALPCPDEYKAFRPGSASNIYACDAIYYAGEANAGVKEIALNLPFDTDVQRDKGTRTILLENVVNNKYNYIISPAGNAILEVEYRRHVSQEAFFWNIAFREVAHGLGVKQTANGTDVATALGSHAAVFEDMKADVLGVYLTIKQQDKFKIHRILTKEDALTTFFVSTVRSERFGYGSMLGQSNRMIYNYLLKAGAFTRNASGHYSIDFAKMETAIGNLAAEILKIQATGDTAAAAAFEKRYSVANPDLAADATNLNIENVPIDIRLIFKR